MLQSKIMEINRITDENFFKMPADSLAPALLGKYLAVEAAEGVKRLMITETECYKGEESACHAYKGKTERCAPLWDAGGRVYIYLCYGIHWLLNIIAGEDGNPEGVLIRGLEGASGPGKLTKAMGIDASFKEENVLTSAKIWLEDRKRTATYITAKRIGIDYAKKEDRDRLWRYVLT